MDAEKPAGSAHAPSLRRWTARNGLHLLVLWGFAVVRPTLDLLAQGPDLFIARKVDGAEFVIVVLLFAALPPALLLAAEVLVRLRSRRLGELLHLMISWSLLCVIALYTLKDLFPSKGAILIIAAVLIGSGAVWLYARFDLARTLLDYLAPAPLIFLLVFFLGPSQGLIFPKSVPAADGNAAPDTPVIWVMFDELPISSLMDSSGEIDAARFPNLARLARDSTWYRNTAASADATQEAVPAILTGDRPKPGELPTYTDHPENAFTLLAASHRVTAQEHITWLCPPSACSPDFGTLRSMYDLGSAMSIASLHALAPETYDARLPAIGRTWSEAMTPELPKQQVDPETTSSSELARHGNEQFQRFLDGIRPDQRGARLPFYFLHSNLPHTPWNYVPSGHMYADVKDVPVGLQKSPGASIWTTDNDVVDQNLQRHLLQTVFVDRLIGRLVKKLRRTGLYDRSMVVITADHGVSFHPGHEDRWIDGENAGDVELVPFFVKAPGQSQGAIVDKQLQSIDELPTIAQSLGVDIPWKIDGKAASSMRGSGRSAVVDFRHIGEIERHFSFATLVRQRRQTLRHKTEVFGSGRLNPRFYGLGRYRVLCGREVSSFEVEPAGATTATLDHASDYLAVDPSSAYEPAMVSGQLAGDGASSVRSVAIAVNSRIDAVTPPDRFGSGSFRAMLPDWALDDGRNEVAFYSISGPPKKPQLTRLSPPAG